jgi:hypothetical protein
MRNSCDLLSCVLQVDVNCACPAVRVSLRVSMHRSALTLIAAEIFSEDNGFVTKCVNDHNEHSGLLQIQEGKSWIHQANLLPRCFDKSSVAKR